MPRHPDRSLVVVAVASAAAIAATALLGACSADDGARTVTVFAAASLTDAMEDLAAAYEDAHPDTDVELNLGGSSSLREQILAGAPADIVVTADVADMDALVAASAVGAPDVAATNQLVLVVPADNPGGVRDLSDLADDDLLVGLCAEEVPCGRLARDLLARAGVEASVDTDEPDVRSLLAKVASGELDVGIVYRTDVASAGDEVVGIDVPGAADLPVRYPIAVVSDAPHPEAAAAFVELVLSDEGRAILAENGFGRP